MPDDKSIQPPAAVASRRGFLRQSGEAMAKAATLATAAGTGITTGYIVQDLFNPKHRRVTWGGPSMEQLGVEPEEHWAQKTGRRALGIAVGIAAAKGVKDVFTEGDSSNLVAPSAPGRSK